MTHEQKSGRAPRSMGLAALVSLAVTLALALPALTAAKTGPPAPPPKPAPAPAPKPAPPPAPKPAPAPAPKPAPAPAPKPAPAPTPAPVPAPAAPGSICTVGIMSGEGLYTGWIPYYGAGAMLEPTLTITNMNILGFQGSAQFWVYYPGAHVDLPLHLLPTRSASVGGIAAMTPKPNTTGLPFRIWLSADSDAVGLAYKVCV